MRVEKHGNYSFVCGHIFPVNELESGQKWCDASGRFHVTIDKIEDNWVQYSWDENREKKTHQKDSFSFQCRYFLVVE